MCGYGVCVYAAVCVCVYVCEYGVCVMKTCGGLTVRFLWPVFYEMRDSNMKVTKIKGCYIIPDLQYSATIHIIWHHSGPVNTHNTVSLYTKM